MTHFKELRTNLQQHHGYSYNWKLIKEKDLSTTPSNNKKRDEFYADFFDKITRQTAKSMCQNIDVIVPSKIRTTNEQAQLEQFLNIIGTELDPHVLKYDSSSNNGTTTTMKEKMIRQFERDDEKRQFRIQEFIKTEKSYVDTLKPLVKYVVFPLRANLQQYKNSAILNTFKCHKIFLNIDQIMAINEKFLIDLLQQQHNFGAICEKHIIHFEAYYRKYLLEQSEAQKLHAKEIKLNNNYRRYLSKVKDQSEFKRKRLQDILVEPVQRISRYSMMLRDILQLTPEEHPDYRGLKLACEKAQEIATMADDDPTKIATMFLNLYQGIKDSPCSLINQKRSLVAHLDATEIHRVTNKPTRTVSLFLFTDKILVASREASKEIDLDELLDNHTSTSTCSTTSSSTSLLFSSSSNGNTKKTEKNQQGLKFKGWADIESIELFDGISKDRPGSFILTATRVQETQKNEMSNITSFENYFYKGPRLFSIQPSSDNTAAAAAATATKKQQQKSAMEKANEFKDLYHKTRALVKQYEPTDKTFHKMWKGVPTFCNVYDQDSYITAKYKNDAALIYVDDDSVDTDQLFTRTTSLFNPWIIGLIQPEKMKGFRFNICTKLNFPAPPPPSSKSSNTIDFESIFWNNLFYLDGLLKQSIEFSTQNMMKIQYALYNPILVNGNNTRSRTRTMSRTSSIPSIGKLFKNDEAAGSTTTIIKKAKSFSPALPHTSTTTPVQRHYQAPKRVPVHHSWSNNNSSDISTTSQNNNSSIATLSSSIWSSSSGEEMGVSCISLDHLDHHHEQQPQQQLNVSSPGEKKQCEPAAMIRNSSGGDQQPQQHHNKTHSISRTISSIGSSGSMIEDDGNDDDDIDLVEIVDCLAIKTPSPLSACCHDNDTTGTKTPPPSSPDDHHHQRNSVGFEDEMQQQWKALITKYL